MIKLIPCPTCRRHVKATDAVCPFCRSAPRREGPLGLVGAAAVGIAVAVLASNGSACGSNVAGAGGVDAGADADDGLGGSGGMSLYGPPPPP